MLKLTIASNKKPILLNPACIVSVVESTATGVSLVRMSDGKEYEIKEPIDEIAAKFPRGWGL